MENSGTIIKLALKIAGCMILIFTCQVRAASTSARIIPHTTGVTLDGATVAFPKEGSKKPLVLVLSFSHSASGDVTRWNQQFQSAYTNGSIDYYDLADFQGVPSFIMRMILHGMRKSIPEPAKAHFIPFFKNEAFWKTLVNYKDSKIAYVVLAGGSGRVVMQVRGPANPSKAAAVKSAAAKL